MAPRAQPARRRRRSHMQPPPSVDVALPPPPPAARAMGRRVPTLTTHRCLLDLALADAASCRRCTDGFGVGGDPLLELVCSCRRRRRCRRDCRRRRPTVDAGTRAPGGRLFLPSRGGEQPPPPPASSDSPGRASSSAPPSAPPGHP
ncbi:protein FAM246C-like [Rhipicephalus sanguineus]|uniref:protein FAM246C-like n=1 Tax=Rhipicephalus sanguineus TaxID=34632 RepID=UPI0020C2FC83|nr:protein FAM246C-like [Rhipicephalus sanguineus]